MLYKFLYLILAILGVGIPFDSPWHYFYGFIIAFFLFFGTKNNLLQLKFIICGILLLVGCKFIPKIEIIEQQRLLVENNKIISPSEFINNLDLYPFSQTADGYVQKQPFANRIVRDINIINKPWSLRSGYVNRVEYNFYDSVSNLTREFLPFVVCYKISESLIKRGLAIQGTFYFNKQFITYNKITNINFSHKDLNQYFYGFGIDNSTASSTNIELILKLKKNTLDYLLIFVEVFLKSLGVILLGYGFCKISLQNVDLKEILILMIWICVGYFLLRFRDKFLWAEIFASGGSDGIIHGGFPYTMLEHLIKGNFYDAIKSPESVFYFMPGMRYIRFLEMIIFGDAYPLQIILFLFVPIVYHRFFKLFLKGNQAFITSIIMIIGAFNFMGMGYIIHQKSLLNLYGESVAYTCLIGSITLLAKGISSRSTAISCFGLLTIAISIRPNLLVFSGLIALTYFFLPTFTNASKKSKIIDLSVFCLLLLIPLHNIYFGEQFVLLTSASQISQNMPLTLKMYFDAITSLCGLISYFPHKDAFLNHFGLKGILLIMFIISNILIVKKYGLKNKIGCISLACLGGLTTHLLYLIHIRYLHPYYTISTILIISTLYNKQLYLTKKPKLSN